MLNNCVSARWNLMCLCLALTSLRDNYFVYKAQPWASNALDTDRLLFFWFLYFHFHNSFSALHHFPHNLICWFFFLCQDIEQRLANALLTSCLHRQHIPETPREYLKTACVWACSFNTAGDDKQLWWHWQWLQMLVQSLPGNDNCLLLLDHLSM